MKSQFGKFENEVISVGLKRPISRKSQTPS